MIPLSRPKLLKEEALRRMEAFSLDQYPVRLLGLRGYYKSTMGDPEKNDRSIYDDAIFIVTPSIYRAFNANTDPSVSRKGIAMLKPGAVYLYKIGLHNMKNPYLALRQHGRVTVIRDGLGEFTDTAAAPFYIDIHKGGYGTTSSLGCQTIYPDQWDEFLKTVVTALKLHGQEIIPYLILEA